jgi:ABC-2 type transport system permease protein
MRLRFEAALLISILVAAAAGLLAGDPAADTAFFVARCAGLALLLSLGLRLRPRNAIASAAAVVAACVIVLVANIALYRHDRHFDLTRTARFTAPQELRDVVAALPRDVTITYFYNAGDAYASEALEALQVLARRHPHFRVRGVDLDTSPEIARDYGIRSYNTMVIEQEGRRVQVENTVDLRQLAYGMLRAERVRTETVCLIAGHGEPVDQEHHTHFSHVETMQGEQVPGAGDILEGPAEGLDRFRLALTQFGYSDRNIVPATLTAIPEDCAVLADFGPRRPWAPGEAGLLRAYLARGGRAMLLLDPGSPISPELSAVLKETGITFEDGTVIDPLNHYGTDEDRIAIPYYPPHPITAQLAMTVLPRARSLVLAAPPPDVTETALSTSSKDSYHRDAGSSEGGRGPAILAAALQGRWPGSTADRPFRLVVVGNSAFATNAYFPAASNGEFAIAAIRWLAGDTDAPQVKPESYALPKIVLTHRQMQVVFVLVELLLPLSVMLAGVLVWRSRR